MAPNIKLLSEPPKPAPVSSTPQVTVNAANTTSA